MLLEPYLSGLLLLLICCTSLEVLSSLYRLSHIQIAFADSRTVLCYFHATFRSDLDLLQAYNYWTLVKNARSDIQLSFSI